MNTLTKHFDRIGARVKVTGPQRWQSDPYQVGIETDRSGELFVVSASVDPGFRILHADAAQRHMLLLGSDGKRFLCGHDERHWFVAGIQDRVTTVRDAKRSLMPPEVREMVSGVNGATVDNRRNLIFKRQGEWFFVPAPNVNPEFILKNEPMRKSSRNKPHVVQELYRDGGETVYVNRSQTLTEAEHKALQESKGPAYRPPYRVMKRNANVYARGRVTHADHATVILEGWHRVFMNREFSTTANAFLD